jgi:dissimilatory sulfite reductase (desulfoviridin) alpha/beta subunit
MEWSEQAEEAISKVPFFVRKKVRKRVEKEALGAGKDRISLEEVKATQARFITGMDAEIKGYQIETCFGEKGCPNKIGRANNLIERLETLLKQADILTFLRQRVKGDLKFHHEFRVAVAECPNACSQPQIKDIGIIAAARPSISNEECTGCGACVTACPEGAITLTDGPDKPDGPDGPDKFDKSNRSERPEGPERPEINFDRCVMCKKCIRECPSGTIEIGKQGYRVQLGGRLGRHPRLAMELPGIYNDDQVIEIVEKCILFYREKSLHGERFSKLLTRAEFERII